MDNPKITLLPIETLIPYARNAKLHSEAQVSQIAASIREFGFMSPVLIDDEGTILAGHGRVLAAQKLELKDIPCVRFSHLSDAQKRAYRLVDNKLPEKSPWDNDLLALEFQELMALEFDLALTGFEDWEISHLINGWDSDIEAVESAGEHTDGIEAKVTVRCSQELRSEVADVVSKAIRESGLKVIGID